MAKSKKDKDKKSKKNKENLDTSANKICSADDYNKNIIKNVLYTCLILTIFIIIFIVNSFQLHIIFNALKTFAEKGETIEGDDRFFKYPIDKCDNYYNCPSNIDCNRDNCPKENSIWNNIKNIWLVFKALVWGAEEAVKEEVVKEIEMDKKQIGGVKDYKTMSSNLWNQVPYNGLAWLEKKDWKETRRFLYNILVPPRAQGRWLKALIYYYIGKGLKYGELYKNVVNIKKSDSEDDGFFKSLFKKLLDLTIIFLIPIIIITANSISYLSTNIYGGWNAFISTVPYIVNEIISGSGFWHTLFRILTYILLGLFWLVVAFTSSVLAISYHSITLPFITFVELFIKGFRGGFNTLKGTFKTHFLFVFMFFLLILFVSSISIIINTNIRYNNDKKHSCIFKDI